MDKNYVAEFEKDIRHFGIEPPQGGCIPDGLYRPINTKVPAFYALTVGVTYTDGKVWYGSTGRLVFGDKAVVITDLANHGRAPGEGVSCH